MKRRAFTRARPECELLQSNAPPPLVVGCRNVFVFLIIYLFASVFGSVSSVRQGDVIVHPVQLHDFF